jgi:phosphoribosylanthranilate isomerase
MPNDVAVKICGITDSADIPAALLAGANYLGFVFFPKSPRNLAISEAGYLASSVPEGIVRVALTVDAGDAELDAIVARVPLDMLQLHGRESPERVAAVRERYRLPVMKAVGITGESDLARLDSYGAVADRLLVDARPPEGASRPGGNAVAFDWRLIAGRSWPVPWMLAGGLTPENVGEAIRLTGARAVDVSSGVESAPGVKDGAAIAAFVEAARA